MNKSIGLALITLLWVGQIQAQAAAPAVKPGTPPPAAATTKPATPAAASNGAASPAATTAKAPATLPNDKSVEWTLDGAHSNLGFTVRHLGFSKVNGSFKKFTATVRADPKTAKLTALEAVVDTNSIDTGIEKRDQHLKGEDFFAAAKYPQIKLTLKSIKFNGNKFTAKADLTVRDVTKEVPFKGELLGVHPVTFPGVGPHVRAAYEASTTINRKEFGLKYADVTEGLSIVGDNVEISIQAELMHVPSAGTMAAAPAAPSAAPTAAAKPATPTAPVATAKQPAPTSPTPTK